MQRSRLRFTSSIGLAFLTILLNGQAQQSGSVSPLSGNAAAHSLQPRQFAAVAHDATHHQFLLFGGTYGAQRFDDTWILGTSGWTLEKPKAHPAARISSAAVYDSKHGEFVLFGGRVKKTKPEACSPGAIPGHLATELFCGDTWVFDGRNWIKKNPAESPLEREGHAMAYDAARSEVVLFGGTTGSGSTPLNDTWLWNGNTWTKVKPAHTPPARLWHSMAYDPISKKVLLFGGDGGSHMLNDTWQWDGKDWEKTRAQAGPPALRTSAGMDFDTVSKRVILFSGSNWDLRRNGATAHDTWSWDGASWKKLATSKFHLISDLSSLTSTELRNAILANGTPTFLWSPVD